MFVYISLCVMFNMLLSIFACAAAALFFVRLCAHVSAPYVVAGSMHELETCLFKHVPMLSLKMKRSLANAVHPAVILL